MVISKEQHLYVPIIDGAFAEGWRLLRIEDGSFGKKPADITGIAPNGRGVLIECKLVYFATSDTIPWYHCSIHQRSWLKEYARNGGIALLAVFCGERLIVYKLHKDIEDFTTFELKLDKFKRFSGWGQLL